jgi:radical SAM superfamily enzyme YgiQ (UPF0313 family)
VVVLLISTYDLGRQPFGLASPAAWLRNAGLEVVCADLAKERLPNETVKAASLIGFFLPMHTATRLALPVIDRVRGLNPSARLVAYGLYAPLNETLLRDRGVSEILGGEFEETLLQIAQRPPTTDVPLSNPEVGSQRNIPRLKFLVPVRDGLPSLDRYASLQQGSERRIAGYTEASRGCKHRCRHCPIVPVYDGRFRIVPVDVVIADIRGQIAVGARHITFGDPDFFNGIKHAREVITQFAREFTGVSYDVTIKIEHLLEHTDMVPLLRDTGCAFVTSAVESLDDRVLERLEKGHTRADFERAVFLCRDAGLPLAPTFVAFTPWTSVDGYLELLREIDRLELVDHVAPIQYAIRLIVPDGSRMLELDDVLKIVGRFDPVSLTYPWHHPDRRVDTLQGLIANVVGVRLNTSRREAFERVWTAAHDFAGSHTKPRSHPVVARATIPYLNEPWYC